MAYFKIGKDITVRAFYDKEEKYQNTMRTYNEDFLPVHLKLQAKKDFHGYDVLAVDEVSNSEGTTYYLLMENNKNMKRVQYAADGQHFEVIERFRKQVLPN